MAIDPIWFDSFRVHDSRDDLLGDYTWVIGGAGGLSLSTTDARRHVSQSAGSGEGRLRRAIDALGSGAHLSVGMRVRGTSNRPMHRWADGDSSLLLVQCRTGGIELTVDGNLVATSDPVYQEGEWQYIEVEAEVSATGWVRVRRNREVIIDWDGDTSALSDVDSIQWNCQSTGQGGGALWTDLYVAEVTGGDVGTKGSVLGPVTSLELPVDADDTIAFTRSEGTDSFALLDDVPHDSDSTYVESDTADDEDVLEVDTSGLSGEDILAVGVVTTSRNPDEGSLELRHGITSGATTEYSDPYPLETTYRTRMRGLWLVDPDDSAEWTAGKLAAANLRYQNRDESES